MNSKTKLFAASILLSTLVAAQSSSLDITESTLAQMQADQDAFELAAHGPYSEGESLTLTLKSNTYWCAMVDTDQDAFILTVGPSSATLIGTTATFTQSWLIEESPTEALGGIIFYDCAADDMTYTLR